MGELKSYLYWQGTFDLLGEGCLYSTESTQNEDITRSLPQKILSHVGGRKAKKMRYLVPRKFYLKGSFKKYSEIGLRAQTGQRNRNESNLAIFN